MKASSYPTLLLLLISTIVFAQEPALRSVTVSVGGGRSFSSAALKQHALMGDGAQAGADVFVPLLRKGWDGSVKQAGLSWSFGKSKSASRVGKTKAAGGGGAAAASYAATSRAVAPTDTPRTAKQTPGTTFGERVKAPIAPSPAGKQTQGTTFGEKVNQGLHAAGSSLALSPGNPIGGIIVKGGKNPGGSMITVITNNNGELNLKGLTAGKYRFIVTAP